MTNGSTRQPGWFTRNWKWLVPTLVIAPIFFSCSCLVGGLIGISRVVRNQPVYRQAWEQVQQSPALRTEMGQPIEEGWMAQTQYHREGDENQVLITFNIEGPAAEGTVQAAGVEVDGQWQLTEAKVFTRGGPSGETVIPIVEAPDEPESAPGSEQP